MQKALTAGAAVILFGAGGCVYYRPAVVSTNSIGTKNEVPVKVVKGYSSASYILGLGPIGNESLEAAIYDATKNEKGSSLDPSADPNTYATTKMGVDATKPLIAHGKNFTKAQWKKINPKEYL